MTGKIGATFDKTLRQRVFVLYNTLHSYSVTLNVDSQVGTVVDISGNLIKDGVGLDGRTVTIYDGDTIIDECITDDGVYSTVLSLSIGNHTLKAVTEYGRSEVTINVALVNTYLSINVPLNLSYGDSFNINGTLKDGSNAGVSGKTVSLKVGSTVVDSTTTTSNGSYSFTQTPVHTGNHTFQVVFDGDTQYDVSTSSIVSRVVNKETTVLNVQSPLNNSIYFVDEDIVVNGVLTDDDGEPLSNKNIIITLEE